MSDAAFLSFELLGVSVDLAGDPDELRDLLEVRYSAAPRARAGKDRRVTVRVDRQDRAWTVTSGDRTPRTAADVEEALRHVDDCVLQAVIERRPRYHYAHAGVISVNGQGIVLPGLTRVGKSVLVLALLQAGARYLSDEVMVYDPTEGLVLAFPRAVRLPADVTYHFPDLVEHLRTLGASRLVPLRALGHDGFVPQAPLGAVVIPYWEPSKPDEVRPIPRAEAARRLEEVVVESQNGAGEGIIDLAAGSIPVRTLALDWHDPHSAATLLLEQIG